MKNELIKKILPHFIAILTFLIIAVIFCRPALQGNTLSQDDIVGWKGIAQNAFDYKEKTGHFPLWNTNVFGGMPNFMIAQEGKSVLPDLTKIFSLGLPQPINFFFLACVCFYILCMVLRLRPIVGIFGALAFAFCTYNPIIISAGHVTKMYAIAYLPLLLAGVLAIYEKKYWLGLALATLGTYLQVAANHPQISYYFFLTALCITIGYLVYWIGQKDYKHIGIAFGLTALAALVGVAANSLSYFTTTEYAKATIRGGRNITVEGNTVKATKTEGLDTSYAFQYSLKQPEPLVILMPNAFGGNGRNTFDENSKVVKKLTGAGVPEGSAVQLASSLPKYWGGLEIAGGPPYVGAIICLLALIGFVVVRHPLRWGLLAACILSIVMSWGRFFPGFNTFLFETLPLYNKFRAPSMTLVITQLVLPVMAVVTAQQLFMTPESRDYLKNNFRRILYAVGGLFAFLLLLWVMIDYSSPIDAQIIANNWDNSGNDSLGRTIVSGLKEDRSAMFGGQLLRTFGFALLVLGLIWLYMKNILKPIVAVIILAVITLIDLLVIDKVYLNEENYEAKDDTENQAPVKTAVDEQILADKAVHYRVYNAGQDRFSSSDYKVSTFHKAIGGYHPAKLRIYQDIIERYLSGAPSPQVLNMLNAKYIVATNPQNGQQMMEVNPGAYGPCWFVKNVKIVKDDVEEIQAIGTTNLRDTAVIQQQYAAGIGQPQWDSAATIDITSYDNDAIEYATNSNTAQFAVFSEIFYPYGWNAYIDGKKVNHVKTDYVLRGLSVPAGKHTIRFVFEPASYKKGVTIAFIASFLILIFVLGGLFMAWREERKRETTPPTAL